MISTDECYVALSDKDESKSMVSQRTKVIAFYLPQFHRTQENDEWWGKGFTEWTNVKKSKPLFKGHNQPRVPLNENYYDLDLDFDRTMNWQISLAKKYGIYGFCIYHYWFKNGKKLLERPVEKFLLDKSKDINFCICWANEPWTRTWSGNAKEVIMPQEYGYEEEWIKHFYYLLPFFRDKRYIYYDNKPLLVIYRPELIKDLDAMLDCWKRLAKKEGLLDIYILSQGSVYGTTKKTSDMVDAHILYEPGHTQAEFSVLRTNLLKDFLLNPKLFLNVEFQKIKTTIGSILNLQTPNVRTTFLDYDMFWDHIINRKLSSNNLILGAFCDWDNSPRRQNHGARIFRGASPEKFQKYLVKLFRKAEHETNYNMVFINAWNEWSEGTYLEPDITNKYRYLEAIKLALDYCERKVE